MGTIRILNILGKEPTGGVGSMVLNFKKGFTDRIDVEYAVFCEKKDTRFNKDAEKYGVVTHLLPDLSLKNYHRIIKKLSHLLESGNYDIVHLHSPVLSTICLRLARDKGVKVRILHYHSSVKSENKNKLLRNIVLYGLGAYYATDYIACSEAAKNCGPKNAKIDIIYNGIDCEKFQFKNENRIRIRKELGLANKRVIGHVGRLSFPKNQFFMLDIFEKSYQMDKEIVLIIVGDGFLEADLKKYAQSLNSKDNIIFLGRRSDIPSLLAAFDIFILPSLFEGLPVSILEAQASGLPCIMSTRITKEVSVSNRNRYIDLNAETDTWASALVTIKYVADKERTEAAGKIKEAGFDMKDSSGKLEKYYASLYKRAELLC